MNKSAQQLNIFKSKVDKILTDCLNKKKQDSLKISPLLTKMLGDIQALCSKGKRLRAAYMYFSYIACGGENKKEMLKLSAVVELMHSYFLIQDDVMDHDSLRHGLKTLHTTYAQFHQQKKLLGDAQHFGYSMAILGSDLTSTIGYDILSNSKFNPKIQQQILLKLNELIFNTVVGQMFDVELTAKKTFTKKNILDVYEYKTAKYTIEYPLHLGAITAGKSDQKTLKIFSDYAIPLGMAFQIQDDVLGIFADEVKLGKPVGSDIRENKRTILVFKAFENANTSQKKILKSCLGNHHLTQKHIDNFRQVVKDTGALAYAQKEANKLLNQSLATIKQQKLVAEGKDFLIGIAEYLINREY